MTEGEWIKHLLVGLACGQFIWMAKDIFLASRSQTHENSKDIGGIKERLARLEKDMTNAHSKIRSLEGRMK